MLNGPYHSKFGGLWIDCASWEETLQALHNSGKVTDTEAEEIRQFVKTGFVIFPGAASAESIDAFQIAIADAFNHGNPKLLYQAHGSQRTLPLDKPVDRLGSRVVDSFVALPQALDLFNSPKLVRFFKMIFNDEPLLFQSLSFDQGSQQGLHQDTAYVVVNRPLEMAACWIALQDVVAGSGELMYLPGSHRFPDFDFGFGVKHWSGQPEDAEIHDKWSAWLREEGSRQGLAQETFLPQKGDILVWHADLAHGGSPVVNTALSRRSLVGHFCPLSARPRYFDFGNCRATIRKYQEISYSSSHYDLADTT